MFARIVLNGKIAVMAEKNSSSAGTDLSGAHRRKAEFEKLAIPALDMLYRQAMKYTNDPEDAEDLVQDTFERGYKAFDSFKIGTNIEAWLTTILRNTYFNQYQKAKRRPKRAKSDSGDFTDHDEYVASDNSGSLKSAEQEYLDSAAPQEVLRALNNLSPERRQVFIDAAIDGKPYKQVAQEQGIKIGTVMSRLNRARAQLKEELAGYAQRRGYGEQGNTAPDAAVKPGMKRRAASGRQQRGERAPKEAE